MPAFDALLPRYVLRQVLPEELPALAADALVEGYDSQSLRELPGATPSYTPGELDRLFLSALAELCIDPPSRVTAASEVIRSCAKRVVGGDASPADAAAEIAATFDEVERELPPSARNLDSPAWQICGAHYDRALAHNDPDLTSELDDFIRGKCLEILAWSGF